MTYQPPPPGPGSAPSAAPPPPQFGPPRSNGKNTPLIAGLLAGAVAAAAVVIAFAMGGSDDSGGAGPAPPGAGEDVDMAGGVDESADTEGAPGAGPAEGSEYVFVEDLCLQLDEAGFASDIGWGTGQFNNSSNPGYLPYSVSDSGESELPVGSHICDHQGPLFQFWVYVAETPEQAATIYDEEFNSRLDEPTDSHPLAGDWDSSNVDWAMFLEEDGYALSQVTFKADALDANLAMYATFQQQGDLVDPDELLSYVETIMTQAAEAQRY